MNIELGSPVISEDGEQIGTVDRLIIDRESMEIREILIQQGTLLTTDRILEVQRVKNVDDDGQVHVGVAAADADELPAFVENQYTVATEDDLQYMPHAWASGTGGGPLFWGPGTASAGRGYDDEGSMFAPAPTNPPEMEPRQNFADDGVTIDKGTNVVGRSGDTVGTVDEVLYDGEHISGFIVKSGMIFTKDVRVPMNWVESVTADGVQLSVTADEAEQAADQG